MNNAHPEHTRHSPGVSEPLSRAVATICIFASLALGSSACGGSPEEPGPTDAAAGTVAAAADYPEGTAFAFAGSPILISEIDEHLPLVRLIDPHESDSSLRRKAFTNIVLPVIAARTLVPEDREAAFQQAQSQVAALRETGQLAPGSPEPLYLTGTWREVGLVPFEEAMNMEVGTYSQLLESPGSFTYFKLIATNAEGEPFGALTEVTIQRYDVSYIPLEAAPALIQSAIDTVAIEIVDEEWEHIVPPIFLYNTAAEH